MKIKLLVAALIAVGMIGMLPQQASATPILIGTTTKSALGNNSPTTVAAWLAGVVTAWNTAHSTGFPAPGPEIFRVNNDGTIAPAGYPVPAGYPTNYGANVSSITLPTDDFNYVVFHWGGSHGGALQAYYTGAEVAGSTFTFNAPGDAGGLSDYAEYGPVSTPEPASMLLVGMGLIGLAAGLKRRRQ